MDVESIAKAAHEMNRLYCKLLGDYSQVVWDGAPAWQRESAIDGVIATIEGRAKTPQETHENWMRHKLENGWTHGPTKDPQAKTHPCLVPYENLPASQRMKDMIFHAVVTGLADHELPQIKPGGPSMPLHHMGKNDDAR